MGTDFLLKLAKAASLGLLVGVIGTLLEQNNIVTADIALLLVMVFSICLGLLVADDTI